MIGDDEGAPVVPPPHDGSSDGAMQPAQGATPTASAEPGSGQVVTIRANRATPPLAERKPDSGPAQPDDADEGLVAEPRPLRPALQARPPRRRRYGNRG